MDILNKGGNNNGAVRVVGVWGIALSGQQSQPLF